MKTSTFNSLITFGLITLSFAGCARRADDVWDDTRTAGRHMSRGIRSLGGKHGDSRQVRCREDFIRYRNDQYCIEDFQAMQFEPLPDQAYSEEIAFETSHRSSQEPGLPSSNIPGIEAFQDPRNNPSLANIFVNIQFPYNSSLIKGQENMNTIHAVVQYLKLHPHAYIFVEGHADERGAEAYNLALGSRRSNAVRNLLVKEGAAPDRIFTVSYGKERPLDLGNNEEAWAKNRRVQFKVYQ
jgi:peptidoglycan-associated lipoprotein